MDVAGRARHPPVNVDPASFNCGAPHHRQTFELLCEKMMRGAEYRVALEFGRLAASAEGQGDVRQSKIPER